MNECHFMGNLTRDPELKNVGTKGTAVVNFCIASSRKFKRSNGETAKEVTYLECEAWDSGAETISRHFKKGDPIIVHCSAKTEQWQDKDGNNRSRIKFRVNKFDFPIGKPRRSEDNNEEGVNPNDAEQEDNPDVQGAQEDIPF